MAWPAFSHPNRKRLLAWLNRPDEPDRDALTTHLERCERCADRLEVLATTEATGAPEVLDADIGAALREVFVPPDGIRERVMQSIDERRRADRELDLFLGLFAIPTDAAALMLPDEPEDERDANRRTGEEDQ